MPRVLEASKPQEVAQTKGQGKLKQNRTGKKLEQNLDNPIIRSVFLARKKLKSGGGFRIFVLFVWF